MLSWLADTIRSRSLKARIERTLNESLARLTEATLNQPVYEDPGRWSLIGALNERTITQQERTDARTRARRLVRENPHAAQILRLLESYVAGPGLQLHHEPQSPEADEHWEAFLEKNADHYSYREHARRCWRDGEAFIRVFPDADGIPVVRFIDPETIADPTNAETEGIITEAHDVETRLYYLQIDPITQQLREAIPAEFILHSRINADTNEKRGNTILYPILSPLDCYQSWVNTELQARKLQASIVLWRKVQGSPNAIESMVNEMSTAATARPGASTPTRQERFMPGGIITTNQSTEIEFLQPKTNLRDSVPLGRMMLLAMAAGAGLPEFMLTSDASNANYASTMIAEGPAVKVFESQQNWFAGELTKLWRMVTGRTDVRPRWGMPQLVNRDRNQERQADVSLVDAKVISRAEAARRDGVDPQVMRREIDAEKDLDPELPKEQPQDRS